MESSNVKIKVVKYRANLLLQILLYFNVYVAHCWTVIYGCSILYKITYLWNFQGAFIMLGFVASVIVEYGRLYAGYSGNLHARTGDLSTFLIISPLIQLPILVFLLLSTALRNTVTHFLTYTILCFMGSEFFCGLYAWRKLSLHQHELFKIKREIYLQRRGQAKQQRTNEEHLEVVEEEEDDDDDDDDNNWCDDKEDYKIGTKSKFYLKKNEKRK